MRGVAKTIARRVSLKILVHDPRIVGRQEVRRLRAMGLL
jgi:hypothetical protein